MVQSAAWVLHWSMVLSDRASTVPVQYPPRSVENDSTARLSSASFSFFIGTSLVGGEIPPRPGRAFSPTPDARQTARAAAVSTSIDISHSCRPGLVARAGADPVQ